MGHVRRRMTELARTIFREKRERGVSVLVRRGDFPPRDQVAKVRKFLTTLIEIEPRTIFVDCFARNLRMTTRIPDLRDERLEID